RLDNTRDSDRNQDPDQHDRQPIAPAADRGQGRDRGITVLTDKAIEWGRTNLQGSRRVRARDDRLGERTRQRCTLSSSTGCARPFRLADVSRYLILVGRGRGDTADLAAVDLPHDAVEAFTLQHSGRDHSLELPDLAHDRVEPIALLRNLAHEAIPALDRRGVPGVEARDLEPEPIEPYDIHYAATPHTKLL